MANINMALILCTVLMLVAIEGDGYPTTLGTSTTTVGPTTLGTSTTTGECSGDETKVVNCYAFYCYNNQWQPFEFTATEHCCLTSDHPKCILFGFTSASSTTTMG